MACDADILWLRNWLILRRAAASYAPDPVTYDEDCAETMNKLKELPFLTTGKEWWWDWFGGMGLISIDELRDIRRHYSRNLTRCNDKEKSSDHE